MKVLKLASCLFFVLLLSYGEARAPQLTAHDARIKVEEILKAHATHHKLKPELIRRALGNYIEELDPGKTYFIKDDIKIWLEPSEELIVKTIKDFKNEAFTTFEEIHEVMICAIARRNALEGKIDSNNLPKNVQPAEFKEIDWVLSEDELFNRLIRIRSLQIETAEKLEQETKQQFLQRLGKRRYAREEELITHSPTERRQVVLSYALKSISSALDSQTAYFTPSEASQFMIQVQQRLYGIVAQLRDDLNGITVLRLLDDGPASLGKKLKVGDRIIAVNGETIVGMDLIDAVELIRGPQGTRVELTVIRAKSPDSQNSEEKITIEIVRGEVVLKETRYETSYEPFGDGAIGYLHLFSFYQDSKSSSASDLQHAIEQLKREHSLKGIVLDLRNNGGGLLPQAVAVTGLFIKKGVVVSVKDNTKEIQRLRNIESHAVWEGPLIILANRASASAAEIVAQTLQDYGRALVIGDAETYGKGTFQTFTLEASNFGKVNPKGEYKVTRGRYYTVSGKSPQLVGVKPDIVVPGILSQMEIGERFAKFPLPNDEIPASFEDDLSDIPPIHRAQINRLYKFDLQTVLTTYKPYLETLQKNSAKRIDFNQNYQNFLRELEKKEFMSQSIEIFGQGDLQLNETTNIMKDLILLTSEESRMSNPPSPRPSDAKAAA